LAIQTINLLGDFHPDPVDRMITALARHVNAPLITADERILNYKHVKTIWWSCSVLCWSKWVISYKYVNTITNRSAQRISQKRRIAYRSQMG